MSAICFMGVCVTSVWYVCFLFVFCLFVVVCLLLFLLLSTCLNDLYVRPLSCFIGTFPIALLLDLPSRD